MANPNHCIEQPLPFAQAATCQIRIWECTPRHFDDGTEIRFVTSIQGTEYALGAQLETLHEARLWASAARQGMQVMGARDITYVEELFEDTLEAEAARDARE